MVSAVVIYAFSRRITKPVKQLTEQAQKIADGHLEEQIAVQSRDEIGQLATAFNRMTGSLQVTMTDRAQALAELQELNRTLEDRIRQRTLELEERGVALERSLEDVRAMGEVSRAIGSSLDLGEVSRYHLDSCASPGGRCRLRHLRAGCRARALDGRIVGGLDEQILKILEGARASAEAGSDDPIARVLAIGQPVQIPTSPWTPACPVRRSICRRGCAPLLALPMGSAGARHVMVVYRREPGRLDERRRGAAEHSRQPVSSRHRQCAPLQGAGWQEPSAGGGQPPQVRLSREREPRAAHTHERHPGLQRADPRPGLWTDLQGHAPAPHGYPARAASTCFA